jgi:hypothetical protein
MTENYAGARTLATVEHCGLTFRIVRRRFKGKLWRKYLTLLYEDLPISDGTFPPTTDPQECVKFYRDILRRVCPTRARTDEQLAILKARGQK